MLRYVHSLCMQSTWLAQPLTRICPMLFQYCHVSLHIFACKWLMGVRTRYVLLYSPINLQTLHATVSSLRKVRECGDMHAQKAKTSHTVILMMRAWAVWERNYFVAAWPGGNACSRKTRMSEDAHISRTAISEIAQVSKNARTSEHPRRTEYKEETRSTAPRQGHAPSRGSSHRTSP